MLCVAGCSSYGARSDGSDAGGGYAAEDASVDAASNDAGGGACQGGTCVAVPAGWTLLAFASGTNVACPAGYGQTTDSPSFDPASPCTCNCVTTTPPNCSNAITLHEGATCPPSTTTFALNSAAAGGCKAQSVTTSPSSLANVVVATAACGPPVAGQSATVSGRRCAAPPAGPCTAPSGAGGICAPTLPALGPFAACVSQIGDVACPSAYPSKRILGDSVAADTRACGSCTCSAPVQPCVLELYTDTLCTTGKLSLDPNICAATVSAPYQSFKFRSNGSCVGTTPALTSGSLTMTNPVTVCCPP